MNSLKKIKYLILGAGPSGLQMGYFMQKANLDYLILEKNEEAGSFFEKQPVHRKLISINKKFNYFEEEDFNWRHDWNSLISHDPKMRFTNYSEDLFPSADAMYQYLKDYAKYYKLNILNNRKAQNISKNNAGSFIVEIESGEKYEAEVLLSGLGAVTSNIPNIDGIEHTVEYEKQPLDLSVYVNKRVAVIGGGNSGFETADHISSVAAYVHVLIKGSLKMAWDTHFVGNLRAINNNLVDMYQLKSMHAVLNPTVRRIEKLENGVLRTHHEYDFPTSSKPGTLKLTREYDYIINCTGWNWSAPSIYDDSIQPMTKSGGKFLELKPDWESTNIENLYFIGGAMQSIDRKSASGFIHGFRYNIRSLFNLLQQKYEGVDYPRQTFQLTDMEGVLSRIYERFSISAGLFQLYGFLSDIIVFNEDKKQIEFFEEVPLDLSSSFIPKNGKALILTLEFGFDKHQGSSLNFLGPSDPHDTKCAAFLHPVIRYYDGKFKDEFHFGDSLLGRWDRPHDSGGAVGSYHYDFLLWLQDKQLLVSMEIGDPTKEKGAYHFWTEQKQLDWEEENSLIEFETGKSCSK